MAGRWAGVLAGAVLVGGVLTACEPEEVPANGWSIDLVTVDAGGTSGGNVATQESAAPSPDGTNVAFVTNASNLGPTDTNNSPDVYLRDLEGGTTRLVSVNAAGTDSGNSGSSQPVFSPDGTKLVFSSSANNLAVPDGDLDADLYMLDLTDDTLEIIEPPADACGTSSSSSPVFSPDGSRLAFVRTWATSGLHGASDVYVHDLTTGATTLVSPHVGGASCAADARSTAPTLSVDNTKVAFLSTGRDFGPQDSVPFGGISENDVYLRDVEAGTTSLVSVDAAGTAAVNGVEQRSPLFTPDGTKVVFATVAAGLGPADTNNASDVYIRDLATATTELVSVNAAGTAAALGAQPALSPDGTKVAFTSTGNTHRPVDSDTGLFGQDVYVRDLTTGITSLVSANAAGTNSANGNAGVATFAGNNRVVFPADGNNLVTPDTNGRMDLFVRDLNANSTILVTTNAAGTDSANGAVTLQTYSVSPNGSTITFSTTASNHGPADTNGLADLYVTRYHPRADLAVTLTATPDPVTTGTQLTYDVHVTNAGPDTARVAAVAITLPAGVTFLAAESSAGPCAAGAGTPVVVACPLGDVARGDSAPTTLQVSVDAPGGTDLTTTAITASTTIDPHSTDNRAEITTTVEA